ncbi:protein of unknown function [Candidatus Promineifilum breve]|uniref:Major capsid protein n=1 Tax=Candidatus Promineifilum breve TaxID=1806508 RepID=A0A161KAT7_9CHLR|nr:major capsid protein [Candidatus Promineifilum breve]CUS04233.2 protein of unknown function [Candidatus Promineifilum breve]
MDLDFTQVIADLGGRLGFFEIARQTRAPASYLFNRFLPEQVRPTYDVSAGSMRITPTMAGLSGMDSRYAQVGAIDARTFMERTAKLTASVPLTENALREIYAFSQALSGQGGDVRGWLRGEIEAIFNNVVMQAQLDTMEWLRGQALSEGTGINWRYDNVSLTVNYGIPVGNILTVRTIASNNAYGGSTSKFWEDVRAAQRLLNYRVTAFIAHPDTIDAIIHNTVNTARVIGQDVNGGWFDIQRFTGTTEQPSGDARDTLRLWAYGLEGEVIDPANPTQTKKVPFLEPGKLIAIGQAGRGGYVVGMGAQEDPLDNRPVGYTHIGPTVEGANVPGRWGRMYVPQERPWELHGESVTNGLPVIEDPSKVVIATTELA